MKTAAPSRRDRLRQMLADLHMPGALETEPALRSYVDSNLTTEDPLLGGRRQRTARNILDVIARAFLSAP